MLKNKIKEFRKEKKLSQMGLAKLINSSDKYISSLETKENMTLSIEKFAEIAKAMQISEFRIILVIKEYLNYSCTLRRL